MLKYKMLIKLFVLNCVSEGFSSAVYRIAILKYTAYGHPSLTQFSTNNLSAFYILTYILNLIFKTYYLEL
jgi:hypothetical protein